MVKGKFTYLNVLDLVFRIEKATNQYLLKERKQIEVLFSSCQERGKPFKVYRSKVYRLLKKKAFGEPRILNAIKRMSGYTKVMAIWNVLIILSMQNLVIIALLESKVSTFAAFFNGTIFGLIPAALVWLFCHVIFNEILKEATQQRIKSKDSIPFRIAMAQFWGYSG